MVVSNSHNAARPQAGTEVPAPTHNTESSGGEKSVLQAKLTKLAIQIGYAGIVITKMCHCII